MEASVLVILKDDARSKKVLKLRGTEAQSLLNLLQAVRTRSHKGSCCLLTFLEQQLNVIDHEPSKSLWVNALIKLARKTSLYPECMVLKGVKLTGVSAVDGGSYGDVWKAKFEGKDMAVKVLKVYQKSDIDKLLRVSATHLSIDRVLPIAILNSGVLLRSCHLETAAASKYFVRAIPPHSNARLRRKYIVIDSAVRPFFGIYHIDSDSPRVCLASPWMSFGNVRRYLSDFPEKDCRPLVSLSACRLSDSFTCLARYWISPKV